MDIQAGRDRKENLSRLWDQVRPFVCQIANRFGAGDQTEDLIHEGFLGITDAARKYDAGQGAQFLTFAEYDIRARMGRYMGDSGPVRLPKWAAGTVRKYRKAVSEFEKAHGREPSDIETAFLLGLNVDYSGQWVRKLNRIRAAAMEPTSLDRPINEGGTTFGELQPSASDQEETILDSIFRAEMAAAVRERVDALPESEAGVIRDKYRDGLTLAQIGERNGYTRSRAQQLEATALRKLRTGKSLQRLRPFYLELYGSAMRGSGAGLFSRTWTSSTEREALRLLELDGRRGRQRHGLTVEELSKDPISEEIAGSCREIFAGSLRAEA